VDEGPVQEEGPQYFGEIEVVGVSVEGLEFDALELVHVGEHHDEVLAD